jgi:transposase
MGVKPQIQFKEQIMETSKIKGHGEKLTRLRELALAALMNSSTLEEAAQKAGISVSTLRRWLQNPDFRKDYEEEKRHIRETATREISGAVADGIRVLRNQINFGWTDPKCA